MLTYPPREREAGFTLVELLVVITILTIIGGIVTTTVVRSIQVSHRAQQRAESLATLQNSLQRIGQEIRAADPLLLETGMDVERDIGIQILRGGQKHLVRYYIDVDGDLVEDREIWDLDGTTPESEVEGRLLASNVVLDNVTFTYYDDVFIDPADDTATGRVIDCAVDGVIEDAECLAEYLGAAFVEIRVRTDLIQTADQEIVSLINLRNERST